MTGASVVQWPRFRDGRINRLDTEAGSTIGQRRGDFTGYWRFSERALIGWALAFVATYFFMNGTETVFLYYQF